MALLFSGTHTIWNENQHLVEIHETAAITESTTARSIGSMEQRQGPFQKLQLRRSQADCEDEVPGW